MPTFLVLVASVLLLGFFGAGVIPVGVFQPVAALLCIGGLFAPGAGDRRVGWLSLLAIALVALVFFTAVPFPSGLDRVMKSRVVAQNELVRKATGEAAHMGLAEPEAPHFCLSRNRAGTLRFVLLLVAGFAAAALAGSLPPPWKHRYLVFMVLFGTVVAIAGYLGQRVLPQGKNLWWLFEVAHGSPIGCFINRNHFAGFVAMLCPLAAVLFTDDLSRRRYPEAALWILCFLAMSFAVFMSLSRGAWLAYLASGLVLVGFTLLRRRFRTGLCLLAVILLALAAIVLPARQEFGDRIESTADSSEDSSLKFRLSTWRDSLRILPDYPLLGVGANGLRMILPQYRRTTTRREADFAENEYIQVPVELGLCGLALIVPLCVLVAFRWRENSLAGVITPTIGLAVGGAVAVVVTHAAVDFAIRVPLYFVVFCSMVGLVVGQGATRDEADVAAKKPSLGERLTARIAVPVVGIMIVGVVSLYGRAPHDYDADGYIARAGPVQLVQALEWGPTSWRVWYSLGRASAALDATDEIKFGERCIARAAEYDPNNYYVWRELATVRLRMGDRDGAMKAYKQARNLRSWIRIPELE